MKKYDIYSLGNALVDLEFEVTEKELQQLRVDKGVMTLINEKQHHNLLVDLEGLKHTKACGGSSANTVNAAQLLGAKTYYACRVANDSLGDFFHHALASKGIHTNLNHSNRCPGITGKCVVMVTPDAERTMHTFIGVADTLSINDIDAKAIKSSNYIYIEGYLVAAPTTLHAAVHARKIAQEAGVKTALTLSDANMVNYFKPQLVEVMGEKIDLLFCNQQEALLLCGTHDIESTKHCLQRYAKTFVVTLGKKGSIAFDGAHYFHAHAATETAVDSLGAGDNFAGGFLYALARGYSYESANKLANIVAGRVVSKFGPRIDSSDARFILDNTKDIAAFYVEK